MLITKIKSLKNNQGFMQYFKNTSWLFAEKILRIFTGFFVGIWIARYLGPEQFGVFSLVLAIYSILTVLVTFGLETIIIREINNNKDRSDEILGTSFRLMMFIAIVEVFIILSVYLFLSEHNQIFRYLLILSFGLLFYPFYIIDYNFQANIMAKYSTFSKLISMFLTSLIKIYLIITEANLIYFIFVILLDVLIISIILLIFHKVKKEVFFFNSFNFDRVKILIKSGWPMLIASLSIILYMRVDQLMISFMLGDTQLGYYSAAVKIYESWVIIPSTLTIALLPAIIKLKSISQIDYEYNLMKLIGILFWMSISFIVLISLFSETIILMTFGSVYIDSSNVLNIVIWTTIFTTIGSVTARYLVIEKMEYKIAKRGIYALLVNIVLNIILIPILGIEGAAISTLISISFSNYFINYFDDSMQTFNSICNSGIGFKFIRLKGRNNDK